MQKYAVVFFPNEILSELDEFIKKYNIDWYLIPPHITIVSPIADITETQLVHHLDNITKNVSSFPISLNGLQKSPTGNHLLLQVKDGNEEIIQLHEQLYSGVLTPYKQLDNTFTPHITLGTFQTRDDHFDDELFAKAYLEAQDLDINFTCDFDFLSLIQGDGLNQAKIIKTVHLRSL
ncbi:2'-5' RNA ligase family protein [Candidatus Woesebacteria bacterium]|nr:2'-5' RNA ligase family protein [Candidatus Woesebacteria bacterium]